MTVTPLACIAFEGGRRLAAGTVADVAAAVRKRTAQPSHQPVLIFDYTSGQPLHLDLRGTEKDIRARYAAMPPAAISALDDSPSDARRGPGRPRLGVVAREVTLLPRHWDWLNAQPGGASVALRKLVEDARRTRGRSDALRARQEAAYRFMSAIAGDWRNYEEANRALFAGDAVRFSELTESWPADVRDHARQLAFPRNA
ncbi:MAG: DUF2239 family protein [Hyphomonadaceae bacterium]|nr:DUF2239 family protein [Hyphomonadaceae bacterium]